MGIPKMSPEDTTLTTTNHAGEKVVFPVPKGASLIIHTPGLHYNRQCLVSHMACGIANCIDGGMQHVFGKTRNLSNLRAS